jgi:S-adenosylmethionine-diacylglycerol 3-amino-3-carboxypropyl transferase
VSTEIAGKARFEAIRYAQLWEDADILCAAVGRRPGGRLVSIGSAGDNALAMLLCDPVELIAVDLSAAQIACIKLRIAAWPLLSHGELLELLGFRPSRQRGPLLDRVLAACDAQTAAFWAPLRRRVIARGAGAIGKFELYFETFRRRLLPLVHSRRTVQAIFEPRTKEQRAAFLQERWNNRRWRWLLRAFFSRRAMGALGRDPAFFDHVEGSVPDHVARRIEHAFVANDPVDNPYLRWIMTGSHGPRLPLAFRPEHHATIAERLARLRVVQGSLEDAIAGGLRADGWNLSDIFEYMSPQAFEATYAAIVAASNPGARLVYWNMMVPRSLPARLADRVVPRPDISEPLAAQDQAFFYSRFLVEEVR